MEGKTRFKQKGIEADSSQKSELSQILLPSELTLLEDYATISKKYASYKKLMSISMLPMIGLPILRGFVTDTINDAVLAYLAIWMQAYQMERITLRFDSTRPENLKRLMTSNPTLEELRSIRHHLKDHIVTIIMAENNRFRQDYSVLTAFHSDYLVCEIVGPGFDAGDLTRGQTLPHERFLIHRKHINDDTYKELNIIDIAEHCIISNKDYLESVDVRYGKIYGIIEKGLGYAVKPISLSEAQKTEVELFLLNNDSSLLQHKDKYTSIGYQKMQYLYSFISELDLFYNDIVSERVAAASFLKTGLVFWDIFGSDKYLIR